MQMTIKQALLLSRVKAKVTLLSTPPQINDKKKLIFDKAMRLYVAREKQILPLGYVYIYIFFYSNYRCEL